MSATLLEIIKEQAGLSGDAIALMAPGIEPLSYAGLRDQILAVAGRIRELGVGRKARVALVLENGPAMATAFLSICTAATCAPLNPAYSAAEFKFYLGDLNAKALVIGPDSSPAALDAAKELDIPVILLRPKPTKPAGMFSLDVQPCHPSIHERMEGFAQSDDVALVLHTSGTTSRPKIVPLTHRNLCASARNISRSLSLTAADRCLNVMPLFHVHGLMGALLSSLSAGGSVVCAPGFYVTQFFDWMEAFDPTWFTAVPSMHQSIVARARADRASHGTSRPGNSSRRLRFVRSCSAALAPQLKAAIEETFERPAIEAYGMTEASHQLASNPLPPRVRKPGSVGLAAGVEVCVLDGMGNRLPKGVTGEIAARGPSLTVGYESNPAANAVAFSESWFRTGDQGHIDEDGYIFLTGRLKELINRGGEKISPREIDEVILSHPCVAQAVVFGVPHPLLGEEVAAAVVRRAGEAGTEMEIREFVSERLAHFKVPSFIVMLPEIPKGPTGKIQRIGLAQKLGVERAFLPAVETSGTARVAPKSILETRLAELWMEVLRITQIGTEDNFFQLGGDSMLAAQMAARVKDRLHKQVPLAAVFDHATIRTLAAYLEKNSTKTAEGLTIQRRKPKGLAPLSFGQERIWFLEQWENDGSIFNRAAHLRIKGNLDATALEHALNEIVRRHEALRTIFVLDGDSPAQKVLGFEFTSLPLTELRGLAEKERTTELKGLVMEESKGRFKLADGPLFRWRLLRLSVDEHVLMVNVHHSIFDGWSFEVFQRELITAYSAFAGGRSPAWPELPIQYGDFAWWQRERLQGEELARLSEYWKNQLRGHNPNVAWARNNGGEGVAQGFQRATEEIEFSADLTRALRRLGQRENSTLFMILLASFQSVLGRLAQQEDIVVGVIVASRNCIEAESLIGYFVNILPVRTDLSGNPTFSLLLGRTREVFLAALAHQELPYEKLVQLMPREKRGPASLFRVVFQLRNIPVQTSEAKKCEVQFEPLPGKPGSDQRDLSVIMTETTDALTCHCEYNAALIERGVIQKILKQWQTFLTEVSHDSSRRIQDCACAGSGIRDQPSIPA